MSYRLRLEEPVAPGVRRIAREQLEGAIRGLQDAGEEGRADAVHAARKSVKKTRALLRLARSCLDPVTRAEDGRALRDAGRLLSGVRDADVMAESVDALATRYAGQLPATAFGELRDAVVGRVPRDASDRGADAVAALAAIAERVDGWTLRGCGWRDISRDATRTYARGRRAFRLARKSDDSEVLHDWRKRVKDLWYHLRLLEDAWPGVLGAYAGEADRLGELLGNEHDLAVLAGHLAAGAGELDVPADTAGIAELIARRRTELQFEARAIGTRLYADSPEAFDRRLRACLRDATAGRA